LRQNGVFHLLSLGYKHMPRMREERALDRGDLEAELVETGEVLLELQELASEGIPILVEGRRDKEALESLGIRGKILEFSSQRRRLGFLEGLKDRKVVILTDFDEKGEELASFCSKHLNELGVEPILEPYQKLKKLKKRFKEVESLVRLKTVLERIKWKDQKTRS